MDDRGLNSRAVNYLYLVSILAVFVNNFFIYTKLNRISVKPERKTIGNRFKQV